MLLATLTFLLIIVVRPISVSDADTSEPGVDEVDGDRDLLGVQELRLLFVLSSARIVVIVYCTLGCCLVVSRDLLR
jgi:hypothetical protein